MAKSKSTADRNLVVRNNHFYVVGQRSRGGKTERLSRSTGIRVDDPDRRKAKRDARRMRDWMLEEWRLDHLDKIEGVKVRDDSRKIRDLVEEYLRIVQRHGKPRMSTARGNVKQLENVLKKCGLSLDDSIHVLDRGLVVSYVETWLAGAEDLQTAQITVNSTLRQARSVFKRSLLGEYPAALLPKDVTGFVSQFPCVDPMTSKARSVRPPSKDDMQPLAARSEELRGSIVWRVWLLNYHLGMRASEIECCRWSWFDVDEFGRQCVRIVDRPAEDYFPKGRGREIPIAGEVWDLLEACRSDSEFVLGEDLPTRRNNALREYNKWIRSFGWSRSKVSHAVRAYRIECWRRVYGEQVAADWGGHESVKTTRDHYTGQTHDLEPLGVDA